MVHRESIVVPFPGLERPLQYAIIAPIIAYLPETPVTPMTEKSWSELFLGCPRTLMTSTRQLCKQEVVGSIPITSTAGPVGPVGAAAPHG